MYDGLLIIFKFFLLEIKKIRAANRKEITYLKKMEVDRNNFL